MKKIKLKKVLIFGATGFVGKTLLLELLHRGIDCIAVSTKKDIEDFLFPFHHTYGVKEELFLRKCLKSNQLFVVSNFNYSKIGKAESLLRKLESYPDLQEINSIVNVSGSYSRDSYDINNSFVPVAYFIKDFICRFDHQVGTRPLTLHLSSIAAKYPFRPIPPYEKAKMVSEEILRPVLDYNIYVGYIRGKGEERMRKAANNIWRHIKDSSLMCSVEVSVVDVNRLVGYLISLLENRSISRKGKARGCLDVFVSNGTIELGEMVKLLMPDSSVKSNQYSKVSNKIMGETYEKIYLYIKACIWSLIYSRNQFYLRIVHFMKIAALDGVSFFGHRYNTLKMIQKYFVEPTKTIDIEFWSHLGDIKQRRLRTSFNADRGFLLISDIVGKKELINFISK